MGGKQSTAARPRPPFPGVSTDDSAVPPSAHFGHFRTAGTMGLRSRSVSSVAGMGMEHNGPVPFGFYTTTSAATQAAPPRATEPDRAAAGQGSGSGSDSVRAHGYRETGGDGRHTDGVLYLGSRGSLADTLPLHIAPRWFSAHSGFKCPVCSKSVASNEMEVHFIMCLSKPRLSYNGSLLTLPVCSLSAHFLLRSAPLSVPSWRIGCALVSHTADANSNPDPDYSLSYSFTIYPSFHYPSINPANFQSCVCVCIWFPSLCST
ncbi:E3 ubiquitin-protein ligase znrf1 isoform X1 [Ictalurus punctatus]|uniref:RING-type E3 ubiquitin transferase n=1 Tax=Ictalurus punctatus TaxID=7998 RepID=A0A2D0RIB3_ICTPU|nr:E3 ubiquitin-protein ligase znrf1 isoform X1 [Ictalurus punctatus]